ncbi:MAG: hypothetical protein QM802_10395 [Agriterribacter sp.]
MTVQENWDRQKERRKLGLQAMYDYGMGVLWMAVGVFFLLNKYLAVPLMKSDPLIDTIFGAVGIAYGAFRLYRGYQKKKLTK